MTIVMSVLRLTASDHEYPFGIFKLFLAPRPETHYILKTCCHSFILILFQQSPKLILSQPILAYIFTLTGLKIEISSLIYKSSEL